jgi:radical SAM superfamily enzyme YgiQ (UPF0313 family)
MEDILLINPPISSWGKMQKIRETSPPLGILSLASFLGRKGHKVQVFDLALEPEKITSFLSFRDGKPKIVGITSTTYTISNALKIAETIKKNHPDIFIVFGGPHSTILPDDVLKENYVDCVVVGEGEIVFDSLCNSLLNGKDWKENNGIAFRNKGRVKINLSLPYIENLDALPFPARNLVPLEKYKATPVNYKRWPSTPVITSRGCPFKCTFCSNPVHGKIVRYRSPENIMEELCQLKKEFSIRDITFWDDTFTLDKKRVERICELLIEKNLDLTWSCATRVDTVNLEILKKMKEAGCWQISFGVESGVGRLREKIQKDISEERIFETFKNCKKVGIETRAFFMLGIPTETEKESWETIEFAIRLNPDFSQFTLTTPYPGCELFKEALSEGWHPTSWEKFQTYPEKEPVYVPQGRYAKELLATQVRAFKSFYFRPKYILNRLRKIKSFEEFKRHLVVFIKMLGW